MKEQINLTKSQFDNWLIALRSGEYNQGHYALKYKTDSGLKYCCLGVLCEVNNIPNSLDSSGYYEFKTKSFSSSSLYPDPLVDGQKNPNINLSNDDVLNIILNSTYLISHPAYLKSMTLAKLNDDLKLNFKTIADIIELSFDPKE